jgi:Flp pilus assembly CpaF family ATPase
MSRALEDQAIRVARAHLAPLVPLMEDPSVNEIMVNRADDIWVERLGVVTRTDITLSETVVRAAIKSLAASCHKDEALIIDLRMPGLRIAAALQPVAIKGACMSIRKHARHQLGLSDYLAQGAFSPAWPAGGHTPVDRPSDSETALGGEALMQFLSWVVESRQNTLVAGGTSSGKTMLLNALVAAMPVSDRIITIEDTAELMVSAPNHVGFESNLDKGVSTRDLIRLALRFRPDRILVGEVRGFEAFDLIDALNTGHSGGACSLHANTALMALARLENMVRMAPEAAGWPLSALRAQIAAVFRFVIQAARVGGMRGPDEIIEVLGVEDGAYVTRSIFKKRVLS